MVVKNCPSESEVTRMIPDSKWIVPSESLVSHVDVYKVGSNGSGNMDVVVYGMSSLMMTTTPD